MARNIMVYVVFSCVFFSLVIVLSASKPLDGYQFPVFQTESCPRNEIEWTGRSSVLNCTKSNGYMCIPSETITTLLEFCYNQDKLVIENGTCLFLSKKYSAVDAYNCQHFSEGCPDSAYFSDKIYMYQNCVNVGHGCFLADPSCYTTSLAYTTNVTTINNTQTEASRMKVWVSVGSGTGVLLICIVISFGFCCVKKPVPHAMVQLDEIPGGRVSSDGVLV